MERLKYVLGAMALSSLISGVTACPLNHYVKAGETCQTLATYYGVSVAKLKADNFQTINCLGLTTGQLIKIYNCQPPSKVNGAGADLLFITNPTSQNMYYCKAPCTGAQSSWLAWMDQGYGIGQPTAYVPSVLSSVGACASADAIRLKFPGTLDVVFTSTGYAVRLMNTNNVLWAKCTNATTCATASWSMPNSVMLYPDSVVAVMSDNLGNVYYMSVPALKQGGIRAVLWRCNHPMCDNTAAYEMHLPPDFTQYMARRNVRDTDVANEEHMRSLRQTLAKYSCSTYYRICPTRA